MKIFTQSLKTIAIALILAIGVSYVSAWTVPTAAPTGGNVASPLNTSANLQYKNGTLGVDLFRSYGNLIVDGRGSFGGDVVVANGSGITLAGVKKTAWPSDGGVADWNTMINIPADFADKVDNVQVKGNSLYLCPGRGNCGDCNGVLNINKPTCQYATRSSRDQCSEVPWYTVSCTFSGYLVQ